MEGGFTCSLVTPERAVLDDVVVSANLPAHDGQLGVLRNRAPMLVKLGSGILELKLKEGSRTKRFEISGGFAQMRDNKLSLVSEKAIDLDAKNDDTE